MSTTSARAPRSLAPSASATTSHFMPRASYARLARSPRSLSAHTSTTFPDAWARGFAAALPASTSFFGAIARKLSSIHARKSSTGTSFSRANLNVTQPCLPMP